MRLRVVCEVRRTAGSPQRRTGGQACAEKSNAVAGAHRVGGDGMSGSTGSMNQGYLFGCWKEPDRSQSPHSSDEAGNDRGAKGGRKVEA
jgi:hypothetical protein